MTGQPICNLFGTFRQTQGLSAAAMAMPGQRSRSRSRSVRSGALPTTVAQAELRGALRDVQVFKARLQRAVTELQVLEIELALTEQRLDARARGR